MTHKYCKRCNETLDSMLLFALMAGVGARLSFNPTECYKPETDAMEEHDIISSDTRNQTSLENNGTP